ncbi:hypothetical protein CYMTET_35567 [Cymbomonas tetramitiformis]|uniref:Uncharacterized protein n=1 Tax=Cymbomonas tetramitiformis TaxID=36881 RepID=A0AAE0KNS8_9CHLO|nr:hypothetical protein CYMTET_35567 [Cymbomonas tetramitiformis]
MVPRIEQLAREVFGSDSHLHLGGSSRKKTALGLSSDRDYILTTPEDASRAQRKDFVGRLKADPDITTFYRGIRAKTNAIVLEGIRDDVPDLDIVLKDVLYTPRNRDFESHKSLPIRKKELDSPHAKHAAVLLKHKYETCCLKGNDRAKGFEIDDAVARAVECLGCCATAKEIVNAILDNPKLYFNLRFYHNEKGVEKRERTLETQINILKKEGRMSGV